MAARKKPKTAGSAFNNKHPATENCLKIARLFGVVAVIGIFAWLAHPAISVIMSNATKEEAKDYFIWAVTFLFGPVLGYFARPNIDKHL